MITFDLETLPCSDPEIIKDLAKEISPPGNIKKQESIEKWMCENADAELKRLVSKTSFSGIYGRVACISSCQDNGGIVSGTIDCDERDTISGFYEWVEYADDRTGIFCGHNIHGFDLPFLKHRSIILGIKPPKSLLKAMNSRPWDGCIADTMLMWSQDKDKRISLDKLCRLLGIKSMEEMDGSKVAETWLTDPQKVIDYCEDDVYITREVYKRLSFSI